jgi:flagellar basal body rod protein FlgG
MKHGTEGLGHMESGALESSNVNEQEEIGILRDLERFERNIRDALQTIGR